MMAEAMPEALVVKGTVSTALGIGLKLARVVPVVIVRVTGLLYAGLPEASKRVTLTAAWADMLMLSGFIVSDMLAGVGAGGTPIVKDALLLKVLVAVIFTIAFTAAFAVKVTVATPAASVVPVGDEKFPVVLSLTVNVTVKPGMPPEASVTVAVTVVLPGGGLMVEGASNTTTEVGMRGGVPIVIGALPLIVLAPTVTVARIVALTLTAFALKVDTA